MTLLDFLRSDEYGEIFLAGHRITLYHVVKAYRDVGSAESVVAAYPTLSLPLIQKVIAFCRANQPEVERYMEETHAAIDRQAAAPSRGPTLADLKRRLETRRQSESA
jgi:uncharacterized protein (DUF433 family)